MGGTELQPGIGESSADLRLTGAFAREMGTGICQRCRANTNRAGCFREQVGGLGGSVN